MCIRDSSWYDSVYRPLVVMGHALDDGAGEGARLAGDADEGRGAQLLDCRRQIGQRRVVVGIGQLVGLQVVATLYHQPARIDKPAAAAGFVGRQPFLDHGRDDQIGDAHARLARAEEQQPLIAQAVSYTHLDVYKRQRMVWYQFGMYAAYLATGRVADVLALTAATLENQGGRNVEETYYYRGLALAAAGDEAGAQAALARAAELNPAVGQ